MNKEYGLYETKTVLYIPYTIFKLWLDQLTIDIFVENTLVYYTLKISFEKFFKI